MAYLILVRHGTSEWNALGQWTGWTDVDLNEQGIADAKRAGEAISDIRIDVAYVSALKRAQQTLDAMRPSLKGTFETTIDKALNERNYGTYTGKNKWEVKKQVGEEEFKQIRRSWDHSVPEGETLEDVYNRIVPYYEHTILPELKSGKNVLVSAHGNSLRALVKYLEGLSVAQVLELEFGIGEVYVYQMDQEGKIISKEIRAANPNKGNV